MFSDFSNFTFRKETVSDCLFTRAKAAQHFDIEINIKLETEISDNSWLYLLGGLTSLYFLPPFIIIINLTEKWGLEWR